MTTAFFFCLSTWFVFGGGFGIELYGGNSTVFIRMRSLWLANQSVHSLVSMGRLVCLVMANGQRDGEMDGYLGGKVRVDLGK